MKSAVVLVLAACSASHTKVDTANIYAFAGDRDPAPGTTVLAHDADGKPIGGADADAVGFATIPVVPGGTVTVVFPGEPTAATPAISLVTVPAPAPDAELDVHGPAAARSAMAAGILLVQPPAFTADSFSVELGCTVTHVTSFPASIDIGTPCLGSDANLDVLVLARTGGAVVGHAAGRVPLVDGFAMFQPAAWTTTVPSVPVTVTGVAPTPTLTWSLTVDGLPFGTTAITTTAPVYDGLVVDGATLVASIADKQVTTRAIAGAPGPVAVGATDFLPPVALSFAFDGTRGYSWAAQDIGADAVNLHLEWDAPTAHVVWDAIAPPDAAGATLPQLAGDLATLVGLPTASSTALVQYVQAPAAAGYDALMSAGIYAEAATGPSTIAAPTANGEIRTSRAAGL